MLISFVFLFNTETCAKDIVTIERHGHAYKYSGAIEDGKASGQGKLFLPNGDVLIGEFIQNYPHGRMILHTKSGYKFFKYYDHGITIADAEDYYTPDKYNGEYDKYFLKRGYGVFKFPNEDVYSGEWKKNLMDGEGVYQFKDGAIYIGNFKQNKYQGMGSIHFPDGAMYNGLWLNDKHHGKGRYVYPDGTIYDGSFKNGWYSGEGKIVFTDGSYFSGQFKNNKPVSGACIQKDKVETACSTWVKKINFTKNK